MKLSQVGELSLLKQIRKNFTSKSRNILVSIGDDAAVLKQVNQNLLVTTDMMVESVHFDLHFMTPYQLGFKLVSINVSDIYAMGGTPVIALNIMMFPASKLPMEAYAAILKGGYEMASEAGVRIIGGHTIDDTPPKYGLAVVGYIHPEKIITNAGAGPGDLLILTKPIGTGIILAGQRMKMVSEEDVNLTKKLMKTLNRSGADVMNKFRIKGATDITGYGLAGHALEMARASKVSLELDLGKVPLIGSTYRLADEGCIPGASFRNLDFVENDSHLRMNLNYNLKMIAMDAQTSGGLLMCAQPDISDQVISELHKAGLTQSAVIGRVTEKRDKYLYIQE